MSKRMVSALLLFGCITLLSGCWNRRELNDISVAVAMGLDKSGEEYIISVQMVNPGEVAAKVGGGKGAAVVTLTERGDTVFEALRRITTQTPRKLNLSHLRAVVFGEELSKEGIGKTLDFLSRDHETRTDFSILQAKGSTAEKILRVYTMPQEIIPANKIFKSLETSEEVWAATAKVTLDELISNITNEGKQPVITGVDIIGVKDTDKIESKENVEKIKPMGSIRITNLAVFKRDKLIGWLNEDESKGYNYTQNEVKSTVGHLSCPESGKLSMEVIRSDAKMKGKVINGKPQIDIIVRLEQNIGDVECAIDLSKLETIAELESLSEKAVKRNIEAVIHKAQKKFKTDILGFGEAIHRSSPKAWRELKKDWDKEFVNLKVHIQVDAKIRRLGTISKSFQDKLKE